MVLDGCHPRREAPFTDSLWTVLGRCWDPRPDARPSIEDILQCLEQEEALLLPGPDVELEECGDDEQDPSDDFSCKFSHFLPTASSHGLCL